MKILHTSDWHLGVSMQDASCEAEQQRFLNWLVDTIDERGIEVLVLAGDVFHFRQPSNASRQQFYDFIVDCDRETDLRQIVVVGGNHDSPSGLQAPSNLLEYLNVHTVGGITADEASWHQCLVPVHGDSGEVELVVAAVPYVPESKLGISGVGRSPTEIRADFLEQFGGLYSTLADLAEDQWGDVPLLTTGHLTTYSDAHDVKDGDFHTPIHQTGTIEHLPPAIFDERFDYVALGHIHRAMPVEKGRIWYSGTPVPTSRNETGKRFVLEYDSDDGSLKHVEVPRWRDIVSLEGSADEIATSLEQLEETDDLPTYVFVHVRGEKHDYENPPYQRFQAILEAKEGKRPRIVDYRETNAEDIADLDGDPPEDLDDLDPVDVFKKMFEREHSTSPDDDILTAFRELLVDEYDDDDELEQTESAEEAS
ncbi:MAG: exonuclease SbcCD subunit D C-terminal domain-containing protein [Myxococcota bacterium]